MPTRNVNLTPQLNEFVEASVQSGQFENASEVVRAALRLLYEQQSTKNAITKFVPIRKLEKLFELRTGDQEFADDLDRFQNEHNRPVIFEDPWER